MQIIAVIGGGGTGGSGGSSPPPAAYLFSITLTGPSSAVATYNTAAYTVVGKDQNGATFSFTPVFASSATGVATINSSTGVATGVAAGSTNITASAVNSLGQTVRSNTIVLAVAARATTTIVLTGDTTVTVGAVTAAYVATAKDQLGNTLTGPSFTYQSSATNRATINASGVATGVSAGTTSITAQSGSVTSNAITLTVGSQTVTSIVLTGVTSVIATHSTTAYTAQAYDQNGTAMGGQTYTYQSATPAKATINSTSGIALGVSAGTSSITATVGAVTSNAITLTVSAQVATGTITLSPTSATIAAGNTQAFTPTVKDQGTPANTIAGASVTWDTTDHAKATVDGSGVVTGVAAGSATLNATSGAASGTAALTIQAATGSITSAPTSLSLTVGTPGAVVIRDNNNNIVTDSCTFTSSDPSIVYADYQPAITSLSPSSMAQGDANVTLTITGSGFSSAALGQAVVISPSTNLTIGSPTFVSTTQITIVISVAGGAAVGTRTVQITDAGHGNSGQANLTIRSPGAPTVPVTAGRVLHLMADAGTSTTTNNAGVASWTDQSATGTVFSQGTAGSQPLYIASAQNGLPGIRFDGVNDVMSAAGAVAAISVSPVVIFAVATRNSGTGNAVLFSNNDVGNNGGYAVGSTTTLTLYYGNGSTTTVISDAATLGAACHQSTCILNPASGTARQQILKDGTSVATGMDSYTPAVTQAPTIGALNVPAGYNGNWTVHELIIYDATTNPSILTSGLTSVQSYLKTKWGTP